MKKTILIVDDDETVRYTVKAGLETYGDEFNVITAENGKQCLELLPTIEQPDLILLDVMMPEMTGWETFDKIRDEEKWRHIPIIFLTARTDQVAKTAGRFLANDYIEKPCKIPELKQRILHQLDHKEKKTL